MAVFKIDCIDPASGTTYTFTANAESREAAMDATRAAGHAIAPDPAQREHVDARIRHVRETLDASIRQLDLETRVKRHDPPGPRIAGTHDAPPASDPSHPESTAGRGLLVAFVAVVVVVVTVVFVGYIAYRVVRFQNTGK